MPARLRVDVAEEVIERTRADLAVVFTFAGDRPPRGDAGRADWRLCGRISQMMLAGKLSGAAGEALLMPTGGGLLAPRVLCLGLGPRREFDARACAAAGRDAALRALRLRVGSLALAVPDAGSGDGSLALRVEQLLAGVVAAVADNSADLRLWLATPLAEVARTRKALAALAPRFRSGALVLELPGASSTGLVRPSPQGAHGSSPPARQGIK